MIDCMDDRMKKLVGVDIGIENNKRDGDWDSNRDGVRNGNRKGIGKRKDKDNLVEYRNNLEMAM